MTGDTHEIRFDDGAAYERYMGVWSRLAGTQFLDWLAPRANVRWLDVGCGNGAFTALVAERCHPTNVTGVDPAPAQLDFARRRTWPCPAGFHAGDAMALPFDAAVFDVAVMPLVIFFVPDPAAGVREMARVVARGGQVCAYSWDLTGGGFPYDIAQQTLRDLGVPVPEPPSKHAASLESLPTLWTNAGLVDVRTHVITVARTFVSFDDYWTTLQGGPSLQRPLSTLSAEGRQAFETRLRAALPIDDDGRITYSARANAICGRVA